MKKYDILALSSAIVDKIIHIDDQFLDEMKLPKGSTRGFIDTCHVPIIEASGQSPNYISGGCGSNMLQVIAPFEYKCALIAKVGQDNWGKYFKQNLLEQNIKPHLSISPEKETGQVLSLVTPDGERTMCPYLGACTDITAKDIQEKWFKNTHLFYLDGYNFHYLEATLFALECAKKHGCKIALDLTSYEVMRQHYDTLNHFIKEGYFEFIFGNELEMYEFSNNSSCEEALELLGKYIPNVIAMLGPKGAVGYKNKTFFKSPGLNVNAKDTTGAGDIFVGGFLLGYLNHYSFEECLNLGNKIAAIGVQQEGAKIPLKTLKRLSLDIELANV